jgi:hypothetical protein
MFFKLNQKNKIKMTIKQRIEKIEDEDQNIRLDSINRRQFLGLNRRGRIDKKCLAVFTVASLFWGCLVGLDVLRNQSETSVDRSSYRFTRHPVDQVFENHNSYTLRYTDERTLDQSVKYYFFHSALKTPISPSEEIKSNFRDFELLATNPTDNVRIYNDLNKNARGYANVLSYCSLAGDLYYLVEVHRPENSKISPRDEQWRIGKNQYRNGRIMEID